LFFYRDKQNSLDQELYEHCYPRVFTAVNLILRDSELAEDAVQEAFYKALNKSKQLRDQSNFCAWVTSIAINLAKDILRNRSHQILTDEPELLGQVFSAGNSTADPVSDSVLLKYEVEDVLAKLTPAEREILVLKYFLDYSTGEIANVLETSPENVLQRLRRAREKYRRIARPKSTGLEEYGL